MIIRHDLKSIIISFLFNSKYLEYIFNYSKVIRFIIKTLDFILNYTEILLLTLLLRFTFDIQFPNLINSLITLLKAPELDNPILAFLLQMIIIGFLKISITNNTKYLYAYNNSKMINLEYVSDKIDFQLEQYLEEHVKNPHIVNILCISGYHTLTDKEAYLHTIINNNSDIQNLIINIVTCNYLDETTRKELQKREKQLQKVKQRDVLNYENQIIDTFKYCQSLVEMGVNVNFYVSPHIPEFKIVMLDNIVVVQSYSSAMNTSNKSVFIISKSKDHKLNNNSIFESYEMYFQRKMVKENKISLRKEKELPDKLRKLSSPNI